MRNEQRKEKICNAILYIGVATGAVYVMLAVISVALIEWKALHSDFTTRIVGPLVLIPIAILGLSKIADTVTKC